MRNHRPTPRRAIPCVEGLESRPLLSTMHLRLQGQLPRGHSAQVLQLELQLQLRQLRRLELAVLRHFGLRALLALNTAPSSTSGSTSSTSTGSTSTGGGTQPPSNGATAPIVPNLPSNPDASSSTVPASGPSSGDVNPYGVAFVPASFPTGGAIRPGDVLVSNFNNSQNQQGTGTSIVDIHPDGSQSVFFTSSQPGLSTALGVLSSGFVIVGNVPTTDGTFGTIGQGSLQVLDRTGKVVLTLSNSRTLDGPWDLTVNDQGSTAQVFVSNVLSGTVSRIDLTIQGGTVKAGSPVQIGSGYAHRSDPTALVVGPTGLAFDAGRDILYVASTGDNAIFALFNARTVTGDQGTGQVVYQDPAHLRGPLGLALAPNGDLLTTNGDAINPDPSQPSELIEFTPSGKFVGELSLDPAQGAAFGLAVRGNPQRVTVATVNDDTNALDLRTIQAGAVPF